MNHIDTETQSFRKKVILKQIRSEFLFFLLCVSVSLWLIISTACSVPNLESAECTAARNAVREFYSFHFGSDMKPTAENLKLREKFLTDELRRHLEQQKDPSRDYFTQTDDYPKAFRVGECRAEGENKTFLEILLFWKDEKRSEQKEIQVEAVKVNNNWLVNRVRN